MQGTLQQGAVMTKHNDLTYAAMAAELVKLQNAFNKRVHPEWEKQGYNWRRAAVLEGAELLDQLPWKWWKGGAAVDIEQCRMEVVDILHFIVSDCIVAGGRERALGLVAQMLKTIDEIGPVPEVATDAAIEAADTFLTRAATARIAADLTGPLAKLSCEFGMTAQQLYQGYIAKNALNAVRNQFGYKEGRYVKIWDGAEDNVHLASFMQQNPSAGFDETVAAMVKMAGHYHSGAPSPRTAPKPVR